MFFCPACDIIDGFRQRSVVNGVSALEGFDMIVLIISLTLFVASHLILSGTSLRGVLVQRLGEGGFQGLYVAVSLITFLPALWAYPQAVAQSDYLWMPSQGLIDGAVIVVFLAFLLAVPGLLTANPTSAKMENQLKAEEPARGIVRITRHPFLAGLTLWALWHVLITGHQAAVIFFGALAILAVLGMASIDAKRAKAFGEVWQSFSARTSRFPFGAILAKKNSFKFGEIGLWRLGLAVLVFCRLALRSSMAFWEIAPARGNEFLLIAVHKKTVGDECQGVGAGHFCVTNRLKKPSVGVLIRISNSE